MQLNRHLEATFSNKAAGRGLLLPKQVAPALSAPSVTGISSFAFQGTNAHAILDQPSALPSAALYATNPVWQKRHISVLPPMHACLHSVVTAVKRSVATFVWQLQTQSSTFLYDHIVQGRGILPAAAYLEMVTAAVATITASSSNAQHQYAVSGAVFEAPLLLPEISSKTNAVAVRCSLDANSGICKLVSAFGGGGTQHMQGRVCKLHDSTAAAKKHKAPRKRHQRSMRILSSILVDIAGHSEGVDKSRQATGSLAVNSSLSGGFCVHPSLMDNSLQLAGAAAQAASSMTNSSRQSQVFVPASLSALTVAGHVTTGMSHATAHMGPISMASAGGHVMCDHTLGDGGHGSMVQLQGMQSKAMQQSARHLPQHSVEQPLYAITWQAAETDRSSLLGSLLNTKRIRLAGGNDAAGAMQLASLMQTALKAPQHSLRLHLQTYNSHLATPSMTVEGSYQQSALWGMMHTFQQECPTVRMTGTDRQSLPNQASSAQLLVPTEAQPKAASAQPGYGELSRSGTKYAARLLPVSQALSSSITAAEAAGMQLPNLVGGSVVITGGGGMIGSLVSQWILKEGKPRSVKLLSRTGRASPERTFAILGCPEARAGAMISIAMCDVSISEDSRHCFDSEYNQSVPVTAIIHAGGVLSDAIVGNQTPAGMRAVFAPKMTAAQKWQHAVQQQPTQAQILFSSVAALLGAPGQLNYAAANAAMDSLAAVWGAQGQAGVSSIQWGGWAGDGMAGGDASTAARLARMGMPLITPSQGLAALASVMLGCSVQQPQRGAVIAAISFKWDAFMSNLPPDQPGIFAEFETPAGSAGSAQPLEAEKKQLIKPKKVSASRAMAKRAQQAPEAQKPATVSALILQQVAAAVASVLGASVAADASLMESGLDSLGSVELRNSLSQQFEVELPATLTFDYPSIAAMAKHISSLVSPTAAAVAAPDEQQEEREDSSQSDTASVASSPSSLEAVTSASVSPPQAPSLVLGQVADAVASVLGSSVASNASLMDVGLDSLSAVELRNALGQQFELDLPATFTFDYPSVQAMAGFISSLLGEPGSSVGGVVEQHVVGQPQNDQRLVVASRPDTRRDMQAITGLSVR